MIHAVAFCIVLPTPTLHIYVPASLAASGLNVSVLVLPTEKPSLMELYHSSDPIR